MRYISTRGAAKEIGFREAVLTGLAGDGGLYVPARWPQIPQNLLKAARAQSFAQTAADILSLFAGDEISRDDLAVRARRAYGAFDCAEIVPLRPLGGGAHLLELFHGPTLAFKDIAMRMLAELYGWALEGAARGKTIIGATSGDTGGAAVDAFANAPNVEVFMLHPKGRISDVQRRMMTTIDAPNIVNIAVYGDFDDCQRIVKTLFADEALSDRLDLGGVNSINFVRLAAQTVYYVTAAAQFDEAVSFVAPTGNFGDAFAGYAAKRMGAPVARIGVAVNRNDIMRRVIETGRYAPAQTLPTTSPSMDIQVASNFERLVFEGLARDAAALRALMEKFERAGAMEMPASVRAAIAAHFCAARADEDEVAAKLRALWADEGLLVDPHTAVGLVALDKLRRQGAIEGAAIALSTAHPAKFPDAVLAATGAEPPLPARHNDLHQRRESMHGARADAAAIRAIILDHSIFN